MITFKQLEALYWVAKLGGFKHAAHKLHATQSAISKRIQDLESHLGVSLFDRTSRSARLTPKGEEFFQAAERLLGQIDEMTQGLMRQDPPARRVRIGVTEVTAMTWLPRYVAKVHAACPGVVIDPEVDSGASLRDKLLANEIDVMIAADSFRDDRFKVTPIGKLVFNWMCKPGLVKHGDKPVRLQVLQDYRILTQGLQSGTGILFHDWFAAQGLTNADVVTSNSLIALTGLTVSGFGVSYLPVAAARDRIELGQLEVFRVTPSLPEATYAAIIRKDQRSSLIATMVQLAKETCDFSRQYQTDEEKGQPTAKKRHRP